jgi:hypothetical protein
MSTFTTVYESDDAEYEAFPPLPEGFPLRGYHPSTTMSHKKIKLARSQTELMTPEDEELLVAAALLGVGNHGAEETPLPSTQPFTLPIIYSAARHKRMINPNAKSPMTLLKKEKGALLVCQVCKYETNHSSHMTRHMRAHNGNKPHACEYCDYRCSQKANLDRHVRSRHTNVKPYGCPHCDYRSTQKSHMSGHVRSRHKSSFKNSCPECDYVCNAKKTMKKHMLSNHAATVQNTTQKKTKKRKRRGN